MSVGSPVDLIFQLILIMLLISKLAHPLTPNCDFSNNWCRMILQQNLTDVANLIRL